MKKKRQRWYCGDHINNCVGSSARADLTDLLGATCIKPSGVIALSLFRSVTKALLCGRNMSRPYRHLKRYGFLSGSRSCKRRAGDSFSSERGMNTKKRIAYT